MKEAQLRDRKRIEAEALIVGYAMSRLGREYLRAFGYRTWREAYAAASLALEVPATSLKNLRDEFDPFLSNERHGWRHRPVRLNRQAIITELENVSEPALIELVRRSIASDTDSIEEVIDLVLEPPKRLHNVAERLLTGRMAEDYFLTNSNAILNIPADVLTDCRLLACGYDFGALSDSRLAIEIKGLRNGSGGILFTDREWSEATVRKEHYLLVIVGELSGTARFRVIADPAAILDPRCTYFRSTSVNWSVNVNV